MSTNNTDEKNSFCSRPYPQWVCSDCGVKHGRRIPIMATWHVGECGVCGLAGMVTEPRDFGHLKDGWQGKNLGTGNARR